MAVPQVYHPLCGGLSIMAVTTDKTSRHLGLLKLMQMKLGLKITAMLFDIVFLCLFRRFVARESGIFKIMVCLENTAGR